MKDTDRHWEIRKSQNIHRDDDGNEGKVKEDEIVEEGCSNDDESIYSLIMLQKEIEVEAFMVGMKKIVDQGDGGMSTREW